MEINHIENEFKSKVCQEIRLLQEGVDRFRIFTPFHFDDGDMFAVVLKKAGDRWIISDEGHTFMHLSYILDIDSLEKGTRAKIICTTLNVSGVQEKDGVLLSYVNEENMGNVFYSYIQALIHITDVNYLSRERVKSTIWTNICLFLRSTMTTSAMLSQLTSCNMKNGASNSNLLQSLKTRKR